MTNFDYLEKTIDIFEDSLPTEAPITTIRELSARIGYSPRHLARLFQSLCGEPLGRYILNRRLTEAARLIREQGLCANEACAVMGWEDYSSFSRAVKKAFGVSPGQLTCLSARQLKTTRRARPTIPVKLQTPINEPELILTEPFHITGMVFFMEPKEKSFHKPWRIFSENRSRIAGVIGSDSWQFSSWNDDASPETEGIWIHCAVRTDPEVPQEPCFFSRRIPALKVLRFLHTGPVETIHDTYRRIWNEYLPRSIFRLAGNQEFQHYPAEGEPGRIYICLPVGH